jgi:hypothetical protein
MLDLVPLGAVDYLVIGHLTCDITPDGLRLGGSAAYSALTAHAIGLRVGVVTAWGNEFQLSMLDGIHVIAAPAEHSTTFENIYTEKGRVQYIHHVAPKLDFSLVPEAWRNAPIIHLAPVAQEVEPVLPANFHTSLVGLTLQGWLRTWDGDRRVYPCSWDNAAVALENAGAAVVSIEDVAQDEDVIESFMLASRLLAVTEGAAGLRLYWNNDLRRIRPPTVTEVDPTGAGDIFAAAFFSRLYTTRDPWEAARFAARIAAISVTRRGLDSIPTAQEVQDCLTEIIKK